MASSAGRRFLRLATRNIDAQNRMRRTPEAEEVVKASGALAKSILQAVECAETIEELIHYEMVLQRIDELSAQSQQDKTSIENAQRDYRQLSETVAQMRRNPSEYFRANIAFRDTSGDFRKLPRGRVQQIHANVARLRNRASFAPEEERNVWDARLKLAAKTEEMLRALHKPDLFIRP
jgi:hypothetical protein